MTEETPNDRASGRRRWMPAAIVGVVVTAVAVAGSRLIGLDLLYTSLLLLVLAGGTFVLHRWRSRRPTDRRLSASALCSPRRASPQALSSSFCRSFLSDECHRIRP